TKTTPYLKQNHINKRKLTHTFEGGVNFGTGVFDSSYVSKNVPKKLLDTTSKFFDDVTVIYSIYNRLLTATISNRDIVYTHLDDYVSTFKDCVYKLKQGRIRGSFMGYLYGAFKRTCNSLSNRYVVDYESSYFSWLKGV